LLIIKYVVDNMETIDAELTSETGEFLRADGTFNIMKRLRANAAKAGREMFNFMNEDNKIVLSVVVDSESKSELRAACKGIIKRFKAHGAPPAKVISSDFGCCGRFWLDLFAPDPDDPDPALNTEYDARWQQIKTVLDDLHCQMRLAIGDATLGITLTTSSSATVSVRPSINTVMGTWVMSLSARWLSLGVRG
jgi:hypothetical protein